jgi:hypothetical protein
MDIILYSIYSFIILSFIHYCIRKIKNETIEWYILHVIVNAVNCLYCYKDFIFLLNDPILESNINPKGSLIPSALTFSLHVYHMVIFNNLYLIDWIHHISMMIILIITFIYPQITLTNYTLFFMNGFPGMIDYIMLILVKYNYILPITEKRLNTKLNIWIRSPFIIIGSYIIYTQNEYEIINYNPLLTGLVILGLYWNSQYFTERITYNYGVSSKK